MGFKGYLPRHDAIYGTTSNWINYNNSFSKNSTLATNSVVWTVENNCLLSKCESRKSKYSSNQLGYCRHKS